jgi:glutathione synthase/RimK-type ligase-like ATP-grasp enzyme
MNFLGIYREPEYSPGRHASNDALILRLVAQALERYGVPVRLASLEEARTLRQEADLIFSMCQGPAAVAELIHWKKQGALILNDPEGSRRTYRDHLCSILRTQELPFPRSAILLTKEPGDLKRYQAFFEPAGAWLKRADVHATQPADVVRLETWKNLAPALEEFRRRGLAQAVLQPHKEGDEVKFYAVEGDRLFWPYYPKEAGGTPFEENALRTLAAEAAKTLGIGIYGGDAIISPDGKITLIDLNDWPSFAPCRGAAASAIAHYLKDTFYAIKHSQQIATVS